MFSVNYRSQWRRNPYQVDLVSIVDACCALTKEHCWSGTPKELLTILRSRHPSICLPPTPSQLYDLLEMVAELVEDRVYISNEMEGPGKQVVDLHVPFGIRVSEDARQLRSRTEPTSR
jgi:hypothetical protein